MVSTYSTNIKSILYIKSYIYLSLFKPESLILKCNKNINKILYGYKKSNVNFHREFLKLL